MPDNIMYTNDISMQNRNKLVRELLDGITVFELQQLVNIRESANQSP